MYVRFSKPYTQQIQMRLHVDTGEFKPVGQKVNRQQRYCPFLLLTQQKMNITLRLTALQCHTAQSGINTLPFFGDHPVPCPLSLLYMIPGSLPIFCMNVLHKRSMLLEGVLGVLQR